MKSNRLWCTLSDFNCHLLATKKAPNQMTCVLPTQLFGHERVSVLDGGLRRWKFHWFPTVSGEPQTPKAGHFTASLNPLLLRTYEQMLDNHTSHREQVTATLYSVLCVIHSCVAMLYTH